VSPITHLLGSWLIAAHTTDNLRDCRLVTLAGILPDADGLGLVADIIRQIGGGKGTQWYGRYHHYLLHGAFGALLIAAALACFAQRPWRVALLALLVFHLHLLCDFIGSRGPSPDDLWPIFYFGPFDKDPMWMWKGQWRLDGWQNKLVFLGCFGWSLWLAIRRGDSFVGTFNRRIDNVFVGVLRKWAAFFSRKCAAERNLF
jgi:hypothetical protein